MSPLLTVELHLVQLGTSSHCDYCHTRACHNQSMAISMTVESLPQVKQLLLSNIDAIIDINPLSYQACIHVECIQICGQYSL